MKVRNLYLAGAFATALIFTACDKNDEDTDNNAGTTINAQDSTFMSQTSKSNRAEIAMGTIAQQRATSAGVKSFAETMISHHTGAQNALQGLADSVRTGFNLTDSLNADQVAMRNMLLSVSNEQFDSVYMAGQVVSHQQTLDLFNAETTNGQHEQVKNFASRNQPLIQMHYNMADSLATTLQ